MYILLFIYIYLYFLFFQLTLFITDSNKIRIFNIRQKENIQFLLFQIKSQNIWMKILILYQNQQIRRMFFIFNYRFFVYYYRVS